MIDQSKVFSKSEVVEIMTPTGCEHLERKYVGAIDRWTMRGLIKADKTHGGRGVHRRYELNQVMIAAIGGWLYGAGFSQSEDLVPLFDILQGLQGNVGYGPPGKGDKDLIAVYPNYYNCEPSLNPNLHVKSWFLRLTWVPSAGLWHPHPMGDDASKLTFGMGPSPKSADVGAMNIVLDLVQVFAKLREALKG